MIKQVIVIRKDLSMRRGKEIAQGSHASMAFIIERIRSIRWWQPWKWLVLFSKNEKEWMNGTFTKICVRVNSKDDLLWTYEHAKACGFESHLILDEARTEFEEPTFTAVAIGPDESSKIDKVTGHLRLY